MQTTQNRNIRYIRLVLKTPANLFQWKMTTCPSQCYLILLSYYYIASNCEIIWNSKNFPVRSNFICDTSVKYSQGSNCTLWSLCTEAWNVKMCFKIFEIFEKVFYLHVSSSKEKIELKRISKKVPSSSCCWDVLEINVLLTSLNNNSNFTIVLLETL